MREDDDTDVLATEHISKVAARAQDKSGSVYGKILYLAGRGDTEAVEIVRAGEKEFAEEAFDWDQWIRAGDRFRPSAKSRFRDLVELLRSGCRSRRRPRRSLDRPSLPRPRRPSCVARRPRFPHCRPSRPIGDTLKDWGNFSLKGDPSFCNAASLPAPISSKKTRRIILQR